MPRKPRLVFGDWDQETTSGVTVRYRPILMLTTRGYIEVGRVLNEEAVDLLDRMFKIVG